MRSAFLAPLLVAGVSSLPELHISKRDAQGQASHIARGLVKRASGYVTTNIFDIASYSTGGAYYANVTVGSPPQNQIVILDTGSSDLYFDSSNAQTCETTGQYSCRGGTFDRSNSKTYHEVVPAPAFNTTFGDGSTAEGPYAVDMVGIGDVLIDGVQFGVAETVISTTGYSLGLMGIGYSANEAVSDVQYFYPNMPEVLASAGVIASRLYSIYLNDVGEVSGSILFGGIDTSRYTGDLVTLNLLPTFFDGVDGGNTGVVNQFITTVTAVSVNVNNQDNTIFDDGVDGVEAYDQQTDTLPVLLDTGSAAWSVPSEFYAALQKYFDFVDEDGACACSHQNDDITLKLQFGGAVDITIPAREFIVPLYDASTSEPVPYNNAGEDTCVFMISPGEPTGEIFLTLGDAILRSMYVVFDLDNAQVSIAQAAVNTTSSPSIVTVAAGPSGVSSAISQSYSPATDVQSWSIASTVEATTSFAVSTAQSTVGVATGVAAEPADAVPADIYNAAQSGSTSNSGSGSSSGSGSNSNGGSNPGTTSSTPSPTKGAASAISIPAMDWSPLWSMSVALIMGALGMAVML
nr:putative aspartic-type endopeptidase opsb [Quercus suber]